MRDHRERGWRRALIRYEKTRACDEAIYTREGAAKAKSEISEQKDRSGSGKTAGMGEAEVAAAAAHSVDTRGRLWLERHRRSKRGSGRIRRYRAGAQGTHSGRLVCVARYRFRCRDYGGFRASRDPSRGARGCGGRKTGRKALRGTAISFRL